MRSSDKYNELVRKILLAGDNVTTRAGDVLQLTNQTLKLSCVNDNFPVITSKKILYKKAIAEFCWLMQGKKSIDYLLENNVTWWNEWADKKNNLKNSYPEMLRNKSELENLIRKVKEKVENLKESFKYGNAIKNGVPVAIAGKPNSGKSSLLNTLLNEQKAIVSDIPGTTRDAIEDVIIINGIKYRFIDTAGLRKTKDIIESK